MRGLVALFFFLMMPLAAMAQQENSDRGYIQGLLEDALSAPGRSVRMDGFAGALSSRATIDRITVTDQKGVWLTVSDVALVWNRGALLGGRIAIDEISAKRIEMPRLPVPEETGLPSPEAKTAFALPELPVSVNIAKMEIGKAVLGPALLGQAAEIGFTGSAGLSGGEGTAKLEIARQDRAGRFSLSGGYSNATRRLVLDLTLEEPADGIAVSLLDLPGRPAVAMTIRGDDPIADFNAKVRLATDGRDRLTGTARLITGDDGSNGFVLDVGGDVAPVLVPEFAEFLGNDVQLKAQGARMADGAMTLDQLHLHTAALRVDGRGALDPDGWPRTLALDLAVTPPVGDSVVLPLPGPRTEVGAMTLTLGFDADTGESWRIAGRVEHLAQEAVRIETAGFTGAGAIDRATQSVTGAIRFDTEGLDPTDPGLARATGRRLDGTMAFDWAKGAPLSLREIAFAGEDFGLQGALRIEGLEQIEALTLHPDLRLTAQNFSRFSDVAGLDLAGAADLAIQGQMQPLTGAFTLGFDGTTRALAIGDERVDPLLAGEGKLVLGVIRDESGLRATPVMIRTDQARFEGSADLRSGASMVRLVAKVNEVSLVVPDLEGPGAITAEADQVGDIWSIKAEAALPGGATARYRGTVAGDGRTRLEAEGEVTAEIAALGPYGGLAGRALSGAARLTARGNADLIAGSFAVTANGETQAIRFGLPSVETFLRGTTRFDLDAERDDAGLVTVRHLTMDGQGIEARLDGRFGAQDGSLGYRLSVANLGVLVPELPGAASVTGTAAKQGQTWQVAATGQGPGGITASAEGKLAANGSRVDARLTGTAPLGLANARLSGQAVSGLARFDLAVNGPPVLNSVSGRIAVDDGRFSYPARNVALNRIRGRIELANASAQVALDADVSTGGQVRLRGPISLLSPYVAGLSADLVNVTLRETALFEATLGGQARV